MTTAPAAPARTPRHVAVAMDGNGRWAKQRGLSRSEGHRAGAEKVLDLVRAAVDLGIEHLSVYGFSTENWRRSPAEVAALMTFSRTALRRQRTAMHAMNVRIRWSGREGRLWRGVVDELRAAEELTAGNTGTTVYLCVNYGGLAELTDATAAVVCGVRAGTISPAEIDEALFARHLYQPDAPEVDLFLRPSGELRTSNFLPWQLGMAELVFTDVLWPDFEPHHLREAVEVWSARLARRASL